MDEQNYKVVDGTTYHVSTPDEVVRILERFRRAGTRIRVFYGDTDTGRDWGEENDTMGRVGRNTGPIKAPILVKTKRSLGGGALLDHCIVRITADCADVYKHPNYHTGEYTFTASDVPEYAACVLKDNQIVARFKKMEQAIRYIAFMKGECNAK